jgi:hypothetical protein
MEAVNPCGNIDLKNGLLGLRRLFFNFEGFSGGHFSKEVDILRTFDMSIGKANLL